MKYLVLGGTGMAGHLISIYLKEKGHLVKALVRRKIDFVDCFIHDLKNTFFLDEIFKKNQFDVIVNAIGVLNENADKDIAKAVFINSYLPHYLANTFKDSNTKIIHLSTDCVFSGSLGGYLEDSFKDGSSVYDRSKALGEIENTKDLTIRTSIVGPDLNSSGKGLFNWFMSQKDSVTGFNKVYWTGVTTLYLARAIEFYSNENITGIIHLVNNQKISKFELLKMFNDIFKNNSLTIFEDNEKKTDKSLINTREDIKLIVPDYQTMLLDMKSWIESHKELYSHYLD
jgi:dTDP-4-dehydrorhamnose reductase